MKKIILLAIAYAAFTATSTACNTCGCAASNQYLGILPQLSGSFVGIQYNYRWYESHHDATERNKGAGHEYYRNMQLWGRYAPGRRIQLFAFLPYQHNLKNEDGLRNTLSGIGDATLLANYQIIRPKSTCGTWQHYLQAGGGVKMPTGKYDKTVLGGGDALAPSMQAGTGSWDYIGNLNYTVQHGLWGLNAEAAYTLTTPNAQTYKYGNRLNGGLLIFRQFNKKAVRILPSGGLRYEQSQQDYDNYPTRSLAQYTGGYMLYGTAGLRAYVKHWGLELSWAAPLAQHYGEGLVESGGKAEGGIVYLF